MTELKRTPIYDLHVAQGARMVPYAGWEMPVQYPQGVMGEHLHTREKAGLFDVSHMGQVLLRNAGRDPAEALETLTPADIVGIPEGRQRYALFTSPQGGVLDDVMVANKGDHLYVVVNAGCVAQDVAHMQTLEGVEVTHVTDRALLALQGPAAEGVLGRIVPEAAAMRFMDVSEFDWNGTRIWVSRSGYTGEDGYEISVPADRAEEFAKALLADEAAAPIGLGARDSLRLEAGMPLYGNDMNAETSPVAAGLGWSIPKSRRTGGARAGGFPGAERILGELAEGPKAIRRGLKPGGRAPIREGAPLYDAESGGSQVGAVTSGSFGPTAGSPVAMATLPAALPDGTTVWAEVRGKRLPATITPLPFVQPHFKR